jgi:hypothetical protein
VSTQITRERIEAVLAEATQPQGEQPWDTLGTPPLTLETARAEADQARAEVSLRTEIAELAVHESTRSFALATLPLHQARLSRAEVVIATLEPLTLRGRVLTALALVEAAGIEPHSIDTSSRAEWAYDEVGVQLHLQSPDDVRAFADAVSAEAREAEQTYSGGSYVETTVAAIHSGVRFHAWTRTYKAASKPAEVAA